MNHTDIKWLDPVAAGAIAVRHSVRERGSADRASEMWSVCAPLVQDGAEHPLLERAGPFDHFVGTHPKRFADREDERLRGGKIDDEIELEGCSTGMSRGLTPCRSFAT
jgi:hypothetical protein